jgi:hypothetical protein
MLSIAEIRQLLKDNGHSDEDISRFRDDLDAFLNKALDAYFDASSVGTKKRHEA